MTNTPTSKLPGRLAALAVGVLFGCSQTDTGTVLQRPDVSISSPVPKSWNHLYVADAFGDAVTVYRVGHVRLARRISQHVNLPMSLAIDGSGDLVVGGKYITMYPPKSGVPALTISQSVSNPYSLAFDSSGNIYAANSATIIGSYCACGNVTVYSASSGRLIKTLKALGPTALAFDASGDLFVSTNVKSGVNVYKPNSDRPFTVLKKGVESPWALAFDKRWNLYVANAQSVTVYSPKTYDLIRTITKGITSPRALAVDEYGNLYVANAGGANTITVYGPSGASPQRTITAGIDSPQKLLFAGGDLYVANAKGPRGSGATISVYHRGRGLPIRTISDGIDEPTGLAIGP